MRVFLAGIAAAVAFAASAFASTPTRSGAIRGSVSGASFGPAAGAAPKIGAGNLPFYLGYSAKCPLVWNELGCTIPTSASTSQKRLVTCATSGPVAAMIPLANGVPCGAAVTGVVPHLEISGVADANIAITAAGWSATQSGPVYESTIECHASLLQQAAYDGLLPFIPTNFTAAGASSTPTTSDQDIGTTRPQAEVSFDGGGSKVETVATVAKTQTENFYFQSPTMALPVDTPVVVSNFVVNSGGCDVAGGQPFALISTVYADRVPLACEDTGDSVCGAKLCNVPALTTELLVEMVPFSLQSSDALQAGISVAPVE